MSCVFRPTLLELATPNKEGEPTHLEVLIPSDDLQGIDAASAQVTGTARGLTILCRRKGNTGPTPVSRAELSSSSQLSSMKIGGRLGSFTVRVSKLPTQDEDVHKPELALARGFVAEGLAAQVTCTMYTHAIPRRETGGGVSIAQTISLRHTQTKQSN